MTYESALRILEESAYKVTGPRETILAAIFAHKGPFSATDLLGRQSQTTNKMTNKTTNKTASKSTSKAPTKGVKKTKTDLVTVYRNLAIFEELKIIGRCDFSDDLARYEVLSGKHGDHHHHIVCKSCRSVKPLEFCIVQGQEQILQQLGYREISHRLEFSGLCPECAA